MEGANTNTAVLQTMKAASESLQKAHKGMNVDDVHEMMDDIAEQQDVAKEISEAISNPVAFGNEFDEDELEAELEELEKEGEVEEQRKMAAAPAHSAPAPKEDLSRMLELLQMVDEAPRYDM